MLNLVNEVRSRHCKNSKDILQIKQDLQKAIYVLVGIAHPFKISTSEIDENLTTKISSSNVEPKTCLCPNDKMFYLKALVLNIARFQCGEQANGLELSAS